MWGEWGEGNDVGRLRKKWNKKGEEMEIMWEDEIYVRKVRRRNLCEGS